MRILILNQFFWPDAAPTSVYVTDLARHLGESGHEVTIICGSSRYQPSKQDCPAPSVQIRRLPEWPFSRRLAGRVLSYATFLFAAAVAALFSRRPDLVLTMTTPPGLALIGTMLKRVRGTRHVHWEMDLYPDIAVELGFLRENGLASRSIKAVLDFARRRADAVIALGECMAQRLIGHGVPANRIRVSEMWVDGRNLEPGEFPPVTPIRILYSGNLGMAHDIETLASALQQLDNDPAFEFTFQGGGPRRAELESFCADNHVRNVKFAGYRPSAELAGSLKDAHIGLVTQRDAALGAVVPSKLYTLMAAGRPILYIGPQNSTAARSVERFKCGWTVPCGATADLLALLHHLAENPEEIETAGKSARETFRSQYDLPIGVQRMMEAIGADRG